MMNKLIIFVTLILFTNPVFSNGINSCELPYYLSELVKKKYQGFKIVRKEYLPSYHQRMFIKDHKDSCPGITMADIYGDKKTTYAIALTKKKNEKELIKLIFAKKNKNKKWEIKEIEEGKDNVVPVIWDEPPGEFIDKSNGEKFSTKYQSILFVRYESWAILYYWDGNEIKKAWLSD